MAKNTTRTTLHTTYKKTEKTRTYPKDVTISRKDVELYVTMAYILHKLATKKQTHQVIISVFNLFGVIVISFTILYFAVYDSDNPV